MARMIPPVVGFDCRSPGEKDVFRRLQDDPATSEWVVLHSLDVARHRDQIVGEIDFVVLVPGKGVLCIEVKAHHKIVRRPDGMWTYGASQLADHRGPFRQASDAMHSIRERVRRKRPELGSVPFWSGVIFPSVDFTATSAEWHDWQLIDARAYRSRPLSASLLGMLGRARELLASAKTAAWFRDADCFPTGNQVSQLVELLRPSFEFFESPRARVRALDQEARHYTSEQQNALDALEANPRIVFEGPAGTGKTLLALEAARRAAARGNRVLLICFNQLLSRWLADQVVGAGGEIRVSTLHSHMLSVASATPPEAPSSRYWQDDLPEAATDRLLERSQLGGFDEIIVDEAQDILRNSYLDFLDLSVVGGLTAGRWRFFGDFEKQTIYDASAIRLDDFLRARAPGTTRCQLRNNCRNTPRIAEYIQLLGGLAPRYTNVLRPDDGNEPTIRYYRSPQEQQSLLEDEIAKLMADGFSREDIVVLSPTASGACSRLANVGPSRFKFTSLGAKARGAIAYGTVHSFKGLEAGAVIVTDVEEIGTPSAQAIFYVATSRALHRLTIIANDDTRAQMRTAALRALDS